MAEQFDAKGVAVTFICGTMGKQLVQVLVGTEYRMLTIHEFLDLMIPVMSEANRRQGLEKKIKASE